MRTCDYGVVQVICNRTSEAIAFNFIYFYFNQRTRMESQFSAIDLLTFGCDYTVQHLQGHTLKVKFHMMTETSRLCG